MTTILADVRWGVMVADSNMTDEDRTWSVKKVHRIRGALIGLAGTHLEGGYFLDWYRAGASTPPEFNFEDCTALILDTDGLWLFDSNCATLEKVPGGRDAIGTGGKGAMCAYEAMNFSDPRRAVRIVCKHDAASRGPVRVYTL